MGTGDDGNIQFTLTGGDHHRLKIWANIIVTLAALVIGIAGAVKPANPVVKVSYDELKKAIEGNEQSTRQNHEDIVALRNFLEGYMRSAPLLQAAPSGSSSVAIPVEIKKTSVPSLSSKAVMVVPTASAPPLPRLSQPLPSSRLPEFVDLR